MFFFHLYLGKIPILTNIFQRGWNHQPENDWNKTSNLIFPYPITVRSSHPLNLNSQSPTAWYVVTAVSSEDGAVFSVLFLVASLCSFLAFLEKKNDVLVGFPCLQIHHFVGESPRAFPKTARLFVSRPSTECGPSVPDRCWARWTIPSSYPPWN